jgi:hypothetical protein
MTTLKKFLEYQVKFYRSLGNSYPEASHMNWFCHGNARAFQDMLDRIPKDLLDSKLPESVWR